MTIDERLERLTERHEALTQSVEILVHQVSSALELSHQTTDNIAKLVLVAQSHERRLTTLEGSEDTP